MKHQTTSFIKSGVRILGYLGIIGVMYIPYQWLDWELWFIGGTLVISELIGILEEVGHE